MIITKENAIILLNKAAIEYNTNLVGNNVLFLAIKNNNYFFIETAFIPGNFLHLSGVESSLDATKFLDAAFDNRLSINDIGFKKDGTTELKLSVLLNLMNIHKIAKMIGDYDFSGRHLIADKLAGTTASVMGFIKDNDYFYPSSVLKENLCNIAIKPYSRILATFIKSQKEEKYKQLSYVIKDRLLITEKALKIIENKVDFKNLSASFEIPVCLKI